MKTYKWVPEPLEGIYADGVRWVLYQTNHPKGYPHYIGRVCKRSHSLPYCYITDIGEYDSMKEAARELLLSDAAEGVIR